MNHLSWMPPAGSLLPILAVVVVWRLTRSVSPYIAASSKVPLGSQLKVGRMSSIGLGDLAQVLVNRAEQRPISASACT